MTPKTLATILGNGTTGAISASYKVPSVPSDAVDNDGDTFATGALTGSASIGWYYMNGLVETTLSSSDLDKTFCSLATSGTLPYLKIEGPVTLKSKYGDPRTEVYDIANANSPIYGGTYNPIRRFYPTGKAMVCYASPNLQNAGSQYDPGDQTKFDKNYGFLPQASVVNNFPSTGANNLYFYLVVTGMNANSATWTSTSSSSSGNNMIITATVDKNAAPGTTGFLPYNANSMVLVTLKGPVADRFDIGASAPSAKVPTTITIKGDDGNNIVTYSFRIKTWFVNRGNIYSSPLTGVTTIGGINYGPIDNWCWALGNYGSSSVQLLTNATVASYPFPQPSTPSSGNYYQRVVGYLFSEWGRVNRYSGAGFVSDYYWSRDDYNMYNRYAASSNNGGVLYAIHNAGYYGVCAAN